MSHFGSILAPVQQGTKEQELLFKSLNVEGRCHLPCCRCVSKAVPAPHLPQHRSSQRGRTVECCGVGEKEDEEQWCLKCLRGAAREQ